MDSALRASKKQQQAARRARRGVWLAALTLLVFVRSDLMGRPRGVPASSASGPVLRASGAYLDSIGQLTNVLNEFINSLLEKVSFLAEIVIESALNEDCRSPIEWQSAEALGRSCLRYERGHNLSSAGQFVLSRDQFDEQEFKNMDAFLAPYLLEEGHFADGQPQRTGCKLFTFDIGKRDLPVDDMTQCCDQFGACYGQCNQTKLACDLQFRQCLRHICKLNFDYKNATLVELNRSRLTKRDLLEDQYEPLAGEETGPAESAPQQDGPAEGPDEADTRTTAKRLRDKYKACKLASKLLIIGNLAFGCQNYKQSQWRACCRPQRARGSSAALLQAH